MDKQNVIEFLLQFKQQGMEILKQAGDTLRGIGGPAQEASASVQQMAQSTQKSMQGVSGSARAMVSDLNKQLGRGSPFESVMKLLRGAGPVLGLGLAASQLNTFAQEARKISDEFNAGKISAGEMGDKIVAIIPFLGQFWQAGRSIHELWTGDQAAIAQINSEAQATDTIFKSQLATAKELKDILVQQGLLQDHARTRAANVGADPFTKARNDQKQSIEDRDAATKTSLETDIAKLAAEAKPGIDAIKAQLDQARALFQAQHGEGVFDKGTTVNEALKIPDTPGWDTPHVTNSAGKDVAVEKTREMIQQAQAIKALADQYKAANDKLTADQDQARKSFAKTDTLNKGADLGETDDILKKQTADQQERQRQQDQALEAQDQAGIQERQKAKIAALQAAGQDEAAQIQQIQDDVANKSRDNMNKAWEEIFQKASDDQKNNVNDPGFAQWASNLLVSTGKVNQQLVTTGNVEIGKIRSETGKKLADTANNAVQQAQADLKRVQEMARVAGQDPSDTSKKVGQHAQQEVLARSPADEMKNQIDVATQLLNANMPGTNADQISEFIKQKTMELTTFQDEQNAKKVIDSDEAAAQITEGYNRMVAENKLAYDRDVANFQQSRDKGFITPEQFTAATTAAAKKEVDANAQAAEQMQIQHDQLMASVETGITKQVAEANIQYEQDVANFDKALAEKAISQTEHDNLIAQAQKNQQEKLKEADFSKQMAGQQIGVTVAQADHNPQQAQLLQIDMDLDQKREALRKQFEVDGVIDEQQYNAAITAIEQEANEKRLEINGTFIDGMKIGFQKLQDASLTAAQIGEKVSGQLADGFGTAFSQVVMGTKSVSDAFRSMAANILSELSSLLAKQAFTSLFNGGPNGGSGLGLGGILSGVGSLIGGLFGANKGGLVPGFSDGGMVGPLGGYGPDRDSVLANLTSGEFVMRRSVVQQPGVAGLLHALNSGLSASQLTPAMSTSAPLAGMKSGGNGKQAITAVMPIGDVEIQKLSNHPDFRAAVRQEVSRSRDTLFP